MPITEAERSFVNPDSYWSHDGEFWIESPDLSVVQALLPPSVRIEGNIVHVLNGRIKQSVGDIQFYGAPDLEQPFHFGYSNIVCIRNAEGGLLWRNHDF